MNHGIDRGGHLSAQAMGKLYNYVAVDPATRQPRVTGLPLREDYPYAVDTGRLEEAIAAARPDLIIFGRSMVLEPEPIAEARAIVDGMDWSFRQGRKPVLHYDMAHVLGLYGPHFQEPLSEGADFVTGSTHKTLFGPQRGLVLTSLDERSGSSRYLWDSVVRSAFPGAVSNHHLGTLMGLYGSLLEFEAFGREYQTDVLDNARAFARALAEEGLSVEGDSSRGYTQTHQVLLRVGQGRAQAVSAELEASGIIVNPQALPTDGGFGAAGGIRMGTQEMTRFGMGPAEFGILAGLMADVVRRGKRVDEETARLRGRHLEMRYVFTDLPALPGF
jgi:aminomethyltransferase